LRSRVLQVAVATLAAEGAAGFTTRKVAEGAQTSTPAVYELFGDKAGLVREIFFEGFRTLRARFDEDPQGSDVAADVVRTIQVLRRFIRENRELAEVMFSRPFADFDPGPAESAAGDAVRQFIVARVRRCLEAGLWSGNDVDIAHVIVALTRGLAATEAAGWLGSSTASIERRWQLAIQALVVGFQVGVTQQPKGRRKRSPSKRSSRDVTALGPAPG
jgi:AcrR family transcriptional regulator